MLPAPRPPRPRRCPLVSASCRRQMIFAPFTDTDAVWDRYEALVIFEGRVGKSLVILEDPL